jgi:rhodanese-related sulfurtransferase
MKTTFVFLVSLLEATTAFAADNSPAPAATIPAQPAPVTPANDPAYTYKTLRLNRATFDSLALRPEQLLVLDVRRPDELSKIGGFPVYLSIQTNDIQKSLAYIPRDRLIVTVSNRAHRAGAIGDLLASYGFHVVGAIGVRDYEDEGGTLVKVAPPAQSAATVGAVQAATVAPPSAQAK